MKLFLLPLLVLASPFLSALILCCWFVMWVLDLLCKAIIWPYKVLDRGVMAIFSGGLSNHENK